MYCSGAAGGVSGGADAEFSVGRGGVAGSAVGGECGGADVRSLRWADEEGIGGDDAADALRHLVATKSRSAGETEGALGSR
jgi:hypothetical protein